jgi:O-antigen/teichoic acid export membrane protein
VSTDGVQSEAPHEARARTDIRALARGGSLAVAGLALGSLLQFLVVIAITRGLKAGSAGALLETIALFMIVSSTATLGADIGLVRWVPGLLGAARGQELRRLLVFASWPPAVVAIVAAVGGFAAATPLARVLFDAAHREDGATYIRIVAFALPLAALTTIALAATRGFGTMVPYVAIQNLVLPALRVALVAIAVVAGLGGDIVAVGWTVPIAAGAFAAFVALQRLLSRHKAEPAPAGDSGAAIDAGPFWRFAAPRALAAVFEITVLMLDVLIVGALRSSREAGVYAAASRVVLFGGFLLFAVSRPLAPQFSRLLSRRDVRTAGSLYHVATWWGMLATWPLYVTCAVFAVPVMKVFGPGYSFGATALVILSIAYMFDLGTGNMNVLLLMSGNSSLNLANSALALVLNVGLNVALIPPYGIKGAAIAWAASVVAYNVAAALEIRLLLGLGPLSSEYPLIVAATAAYAAIALIVRFSVADNVVGLFVSVATGGVLYGLLLWRWRRALRLSDLAAALRPSAREPVG